MPRDVAAVCGAASVYNRPPPSCAQLLRFLSYFLLFSSSASPLRSSCSASFLSVGIPWKEGRSGFLCCLSVDRKGLRNGHRGGAGGVRLNWWKITRLHRSLEEVEVTEALERAADRQEQARLNAVARLRMPPPVPDELFGITLDMHCALASFHCQYQKHDATRLLELDTLFDDLIQRVSQCVLSTSTRAAPCIPSSAATTASGGSSSYASSSAAGSSSSTRYSSMNTNGLSATAARTAVHVSVDDSYLEKFEPPRQAHEPD
jgi:hypothetical protein